MFAQPHRYNELSSAGQCAYLGPAYDTVSDVMCQNSDSQLRLIQALALLCFIAAVFCVAYVPVGICAQVVLAATGQNIFWDEDGSNSNHLSEICKWNIAVHVCPSATTCPTLSL